MQSGGRSALMRGIDAIRRATRPLPFSKGWMVAMTKWSHAADANALRGQFLSHCLARCTNRPSSETTSSKGQNCTRGGPAITTFFLVACRVNITLEYFNSNSELFMCVCVVRVGVSGLVSATAFWTNGRTIDVFMQMLWSSNSRSTVSLEVSCTILMIKFSAFNESRKISVIMAVSCNTLSGSSSTASSTNPSRINRPLLYVKLISGFIIAKMANYPAREWKTQFQ